MPECYPPIIRMTDFPDPPDVDIIQACPHGLYKCSIESLELIEHPGTKEDFTEYHRSLVPDEDGRYAFAPGAETLRIGWGFTGHQYITEAKLEIFITGHANPVWTKTMRWLQRDRRASGTTRFNGNLRDNYELVASNTDDVVVVGPPDTVRFPTRLLTAEKAPYKLMMSIVAVEEYTQVLVAKRWIYLDVIASVDLMLGQTGFIPNPPAPAFRDARRRQFNVDAHESLRTALADVNIHLSDRNAPANVKIPLNHNVFSKSTRDFYNNTVYRGSFELWDDGPFIPLTAILRIQQSDGTLTTPEAGAPALGRLGLYWDWSSGARPPHPNDAAQAHVASVLRYKATVWPHAAANCHVDHGGKRGRPGVHFGPVTDLPAPADALTAAVNRPWGTFTVPVVDPTSVYAGTSSVLMRPSRIAGDRYRPSVHLAYPLAADFDTADATAFRRAKDSAPFALSTSTLTVWRQVTVSHHWRKQAAMGHADLDWAAVGEYFKPAFIEIVPPAAVGTLADPQYQAALVVVRGRLPDGIALALRPNAQQYAGEHCLNFIGYVAYRGLVRAHVDRAQRTLALLDPQTTQEVLQGQVGGLGGRAPRHDDLLIPDLATYRLRDLNAIVDVVLTNAGVNSEDNYNAKMPVWSALVTEKICDNLAGTLGADTPGIQLFQFNFNDNLFQLSDSAVAATTHANRTVCPNCAQALVRAHPPGYWDNAKMTANRVCPGCSFRLDDSCIVISFAPFRYMRGVIDQWALDNLTRGQRVKIRAGGAFGTTANLCIAHEIGHQLGMPHAPQGAIPVFTSTGGKYPAFHDADDGACLMSYNFRHAPTMHFCSVCTLRLSGWSAGPTENTEPHFDHVTDGATLPLYSKGTHNYALYTRPGAAWQAEAGVNQCPQCNAAFSFTERKHHCRCCGLVVCNGCSSHTALVHRPISSSGPSNERICTDCNVLPYPKTPPPTAFWQPDEGASVCPSCRTEFSATVSRHHCRVCGKVRCNACSTATAEVIRPVKDAAPETVRVCNRCYEGYA